MNHEQYGPYHQNRYCIQIQGCSNRSPDNINDKLKLLKSKKHGNQSFNHNKYSLIDQKQSQSQKNIKTAQSHSSRRQKSSEVETNQKQSNKAINQPPKQNKLITGYCTKQQLNAHYSSKQQQNNYYQRSNKDKTVIKTEPTMQICSERILSHQTPILTSQQISKNEQIKSSYKQVHPQKKLIDLTSNLNQVFNNQNSKLEKDVPDKILDLLMLSTRELKIKLQEKKTKNSSIPKTAKSGLPVDFFNFKN